MQRQEVIGQSLRVGRALAPHLEPAERPPDPAEVGRGGDEIAELAQLGLFGGREHERLAAPGSRRGERHRLPGALVDPAPPDGPDRRSARLQEPHCRDEPAEADARLARGYGAAGLLVALERDDRVRPVGSLALDRAERPHGLRRRVDPVAHREHEPAAELDALRFEQQPLNRRDDGAANGVLVQGPLHLGVHALEALLGKVEVGRVLVEALEHREERRLRVVGRRPAADPQVELGAVAERRGGTLARGTLPEHIPPLADELARKRFVAV